MKYKNKISNDDIKKLIVLTNCIYGIYTNNKLDEDTKTEYLKMTIEEENKAYDKLNVNKKNVNNILERFNILLCTYKYSDNVKERLKDRIENYLTFLAYKYPFKSTSKNYYTSEEDDINTITTQIEIDYCKYLIKLTKNDMYNTKSKAKKKIIDRELNELCFTHKITDFIDQDNISINGRNLCLLLGHSKTLVDAVYQDVCINKVNECINICLNYNNQILEKQNAKVELEFYINCLKANLYLLNKNELSFIIKSFHDRVLDNDNLSFLKENSSISLNMIVNSIKNITLEKNTDNKKLKKVKNNK